MRLIAFGGDERMRGALVAAEQAGWETLHIEREEDVEMPPVEAVMLPWPKSFREDKLVSAQGTLTLWTDRAGDDGAALRDGHVRDGLRAQRKPDAHGACGGRASRAAGAD